jgi:hypothetical protein
MLRIKPFLGVLAALVLLSALTVGCQVVTGVVTGTVTNSLTGRPLAGVTITTSPQISNVSVATNADGIYSANLPVGIYTLTFNVDNFKSVTQNILVVAGQKQTVNIALTPVSPVVVSAGKDQSSSPGSVITLQAIALPLDGSTISTYQWSQVSGTSATIDSPNSSTIKVTLGNAAAYKAELMKLLVQQDRFAIQGISPYAFESAGTATFQLTVTSSTGTYTSTVNVSVTLPYVVNTGIGDVPIGLPVLIHGANQDQYSWSLETPDGSKAELDSHSDQNPAFTPDVNGKYTVTEMNSEAILKVYAGTWVGAITGQDSNDRPLAGGCAACHNGVTAPDMFTPWKASGHAEIFTQNLNTNPTYGEQCFVCHSVGFNKQVSNGGFDDASDYNGFLNSGLLGKPSPNDWTNMLALFPNSARMANDQCENCHGPNSGTTLHPDGILDLERINISADVCGACHGEPLRHGRFQQWQESAHGQFDLAIAESGSSSCARCHTGQGFLIWISQGDLTKQIQGAKGNATTAELHAMGISPDTAQPQTCAVCHDPHQQGTTSGKSNTATVRFQGDTLLLPAGFQALNVGRGAICITCHNTRNGAHNDTNPPTSYSAPHTPAQGDVLMGENAYFVTRSRSPHSFITDTCTACHMELTPPEFSYEGTGTNHTFTASLDVCSNCHSNRLDPGAFQQSHETQLGQLAESMGVYLITQLPSQITVKDYTPHQYNGESYELKSNATVITKDNVMSAIPIEPHGQQGFTLQFKEPVTFTYAPTGETPHTMTLTTATVQLGDLTTDGKTPLIPANSVLVKAGWNYFLVMGDGSDGIHNTSWVNDVLENTIQALFPTNTVPKE